MATMQRCKQSIPPRRASGARLHILRRMGQYLRGDALDGLDDATMKEACRSHLETAYQDFVRSSPIVERVFKVKEGRPNVVDLIKGERIHLIINTPRGQDTFFDEKAIRRAAVLARIPTITTIAAAQAAVEGIAAMQRHKTTVYALQELHTAIGV